MATEKINGLENWTEKKLKTTWEKMSSVMNDNVGSVVKLYSSLGGDFSRYPVRLDTKSVKKQVTRSYGSFKSGLIGSVNGFTGKDDSWRALNILLHDRYLHQRYGRSFVRATHKLEVDYSRLKTQLRGIARNG